MCRAVGGLAGAGGAPAAVRQAVLVAPRSQVWGGIQRIPVGRPLGIAERRKDPRRAGRHDSYTTFYEIGKRPRVPRGPLDWTI